MKKKKSSVNSRVLNSMTNAAMPYKPKTMIRLHGADAKQFMGKKPGTKVSAQIRGVIQSVGLEEYNHDEPTAEIRVTKINPNKVEKA